jgi:putative ABC transport system ATP-binding protein
VIKTEKLTKRYTSGLIDLRAVYDIDLEIVAGEFTAITGPSGAGKSTLLHLLGCLDTPTSGEYYLDGKNVAHLNKTELAYVRNSNIGFIFQDSLLLSHLNATENVSLPLLYSGVSEAEAHEKAKKLLVDLGLEERLYFYPNQLSGGQQQRVAIARALATDAKLILADEPTGNLDTDNGKIIMQLLQMLNKEKGTTIILVTHELAFAKEARRIITIRDGKISDDQVLG